MMRHIVVGHTLRKLARVLLVNVFVIVAMFFSMTLFLAINPGLDNPVAFVVTALLGLGIFFMSKFLAGAREAVASSVGPNIPLGIKVLVLLTILSGILTTIAGILFLLVIGSLGTLSGFTLLWYGTVGAGIVSSGLISILAGIGLWRLRPWAWWLNIVVAPVPLILSGLTLSLTVVLWPVLILWPMIIFCLVAIRRQLARFPQSS